MAEEINSSEEYSVKVLTNKLKTISTKEKTKVLFKCLFIIVCTSGLIRQTIQLVDQYTSGQSIVNIKYETVSYNTIPGITICYPEAISMKAVTQRYPQFEGLYENYTNIMKTLTEEPLNYSLYEKLNEIYYSNMSYQVYRHLNPPLQQVFNFSIPYKLWDNKSSINITLKGIALRKNQTINTITLRDDDPIESIILNPISSSRKWQKCFTFFSHLKKTWRDYKIEVNDILLKVFYDSSWYPITDEWTENILLSMHSPDELPQYKPESFLYLRSFHYNKVSYNRWKSVFVGHTYQTKCRTYDLDDRNFWNKMRTNCLKHCVQIKTNECAKCDENVVEENKTPCSLCIYKSAYLWTKDDFPNLFDWRNVSFKECNTDYIGETTSIYSEKKINCFTENIFKYETECQTECQIKCINRYYNYGVSLSADNKKNYKNYTFIEIIHNQSPEPITENIPEMSFIQFASAFGGLLGMWLGLSALTLLKFGLKFF